MTRLTFTLAAWLGLVSIALANLAPQKDRLPLSPGVPKAMAPKLSSSVPDRASTQASEFSVTEQTEIVLDGKPSRFEDVPDKATILRMVVAPDGKTVLKVHFRSKK